MVAMLLVCHLRLLLVGQGGLWLGYERLAISKTSNRTKFFPSTWYGDCSCSTGHVSHSQQVEERSQESLKSVLFPLRSISYDSRTIVLTRRSVRWPTRANDAMPQPDC